MAFDTQLQNISYAVGTDIGRQLQSQQLDLDSDKLAAGIIDILGGGELQLTQQELSEALDTLMAEQQAKMAERQQQEQAEAAAAAADNRAAGDAFLADNATKEGVVTLESGLQYIVLEEGNGEKPNRENTVEVHYRGTLLDGSEFDSSYSRNQPAQFGVTQVIAGWTEGLQLMPEGAKWKFFIPADLAYGDRAMGPHLPAGSTLIFEVELLKANV